MNNTGIIEREDLKDLICFGGLDLSSKMDLSAYVLVFPPQGGYPKYRILPTFWIPEDNVDDFVKKYGLPYRKWIDMGFLKTTPGNKIDYHYIVDEVVNTAKEFQIQEIGYDPFLADMIETDLTEEGLTMVEIRQTFKHMSPPMKELEAFLHGNHINHGNNPVMNWMFGNLEVITNVNADVRPTKGIRRGSSKAVTGTSYYKIDGIVGMINAFARVIVQPKDSGNIYDKRGMRSLM